MFSPQTTITTNQDQNDHRPILHISCFEYISPAKNASFLWYLSVVIRRISQLPLAVILTFIFLLYDAQQEAQLSLTASAMLVNVHAHCLPECATTDTGRRFRSSYRSSVTDMVVYEIFHIFLVAEHYQQCSVLYPAISSVLLYTTWHMALTIAFSFK